MKPEGFLKTMVKIKQAAVAHNRRTLPLSVLRRAAEQLPAGADFHRAMARSTPRDVGIIAEIKKASPSKKDICLDLDPHTYIKDCEKAGARAISVLTESIYFKGSLNDLKTACTATHLPVLCKDFIISAYQIYEAKKAGASAVLLITTLLSRNQQADYTSLARDLGMEPLVEISSEWECEQALATEARVIGINNRNLATLEVDPDTALRVAAVLPAGILPVAASGISCRRDIKTAADCGIYNFLVGESIVRATDRHAFLCSLLQDA